MNYLLLTNRASFRFFFLALFVALLLPGSGQAQHINNYSLNGAGDPAFDGFYTANGTTPTSGFLRWTNGTHYLVDDGSLGWCVSLDPDPVGTCFASTQPYYQASPTGEPPPATLGPVTAPGPGPTVSTSLPVELTSFTATSSGSTVTLTWETATETNNAGFEVQQKINDAFQQIHFVEGFGTTLEAQTYRYLVENVLPGKQTFRLKQIDNDGTFDFSSEVEVDIEMPGAYLLSAPYPNPFNPQTTFTLNVAKTQYVRVEVFNVLGHSVQVLHDGSLVRDETHRFTFSANDLANGPYFIRAVGEAFNATRSVLLMK